MLDDAPAGAAKPKTMRRTKTLYLIRHGRTEMNDHLAKNDWSKKGFVDPGLYDTRLTELGIRQATALGPLTARLDPQPQVLIASPLSRALMTAELAFEGYEGPREVCVLARERIFHASDVGRHPADIAVDFPAWGEALDTLHSAHGPVWWHTGEWVDDVDHPRVVCVEPVAAFEERMHALKEWIAGRDEEVIAIVAHWGVWFSLTGREFENCELVTFDYEQLRVGSGKMF